MVSLSARKFTCMTHTISSKMGNERCSFQVYRVTATLTYIGQTTSSSSHQAEELNATFRKPSARSPL